MPLRINYRLTAEKLQPKIGRLFDLSAAKILSLEQTWDGSKGTPVFTARGKYTSRGWTEWTQGFQFGSALLQFDATGEEQFLDDGLDQVGAGDGMDEGFEAEPGAEGIPGEGEEEGEKEEGGEGADAEEGEEKPEGGEDTPVGDVPPAAAAPGAKKETSPGKKDLTLQEKFSFVREKYAKGEITEEQYEQALGVLKDEAEKEHREQIQRRVAAAAAPEPEKKAKKSTGFECSNCGGMTPDIRKRCPFCKKEFVPEQAMCPECSNRVPIDADKCDKCGAAFEN